MTNDEQIKFIKKLTISEVYEVLDDAAFHRMSTEDWLNSPWATYLHRRIENRA